MRTPVYNTVYVYFSTLQAVHTAEVEELNTKMRALEGTVQERNVNVLTEKRRASALLIQLQQAKVMNVHFRCSSSLLLRRFCIMKF